VNMFLGLDRVAHSRWYSPVITGIGSGKTHL